MFCRRPTSCVFRRPWSTSSRWSNTPQLSRTRCGPPKKRVAAAFAKIGEGQTYTDEQRQWLDRIRQHLIANLSIDRDDFDYIPTLEGAGGWGKANRVFGGRLLDLLTQINRAIAS